MFASSQRTYMSSGMSGGASSQPASNRNGSQVRKMVQGSKSRMVRPYTKHRTQYVPAASVKEILYRCGICKATFEFYTEFQWHMKAEKTSRCPICNMMTKNAYNLKLHLKVHAKNREENNESAQPTVVEEVEQPLDAAPVAPAPQSAPVRIKQVYIVKKEKVAELSYSPVVEKDNKPKSKYTDYSLLAETAAAEVQQEPQPEPTHQTAPVEEQTPAPVTKPPPKLKKAPSPKKPKAPAKATESGCKCDDCGMEFKYYTELQWHKKAEQKNKCPECQRMFGRATAMRSHLLSRHPNSPFLNQ